jgi:hypothetical protein
MSTEAWRIASNLQDRSKVVGYGRNSSLPTVKLLQAPSCLLFLVLALLLAHGQADVSKQILCCLFSICPFSLCDCATASALLPEFLRNPEFAPVRSIALSHGPCLLDTSIMILSRYVHHA